MPISIYYIYTYVCIYIHIHIQDPFEDTVYGIHVCMVLIIPRETANDANHVTLTCIRQKATGCHRGL